MVVLNSTTVVLWAILNRMFSLTTLPVQCCSTVFTDDVTDISYPRNIASKADTYLAILLPVRKLTMLQDGDTEAL